MHLDRNTSSPIIDLGCGTALYRQRGFARRLVSGALSNEDFAAGMARLHAHGHSANQHDAVTEEIDWFVFSKPVLTRRTNYKPATPIPLPLRDRPA
jgi:hypothetical protein